MKVLKGTAVVIGTLAAALAFSAGPASAHVSGDSSHQGVSQSHKHKKHKHKHNKHKHHHHYNNGGVNSNNFWDDDDDFDGVSQHSHGNNGIGNGNQVYAPINVPINVCGNAVAVLGSASGGAICVND